MKKVSPKKLTCIVTDADKEESRNISHQELVYMRLEL